MRKYLIALLSTLLLPGTFSAADQSVVVSIKPLHSLVQGVMGDTGKARLLIAGDNSPHAFSYRPSQIKALHEARVIFYIDDTLETFLPDVFAALPKHIRRIAVTQKTELTLLERRKKDEWEIHEHHEHEGEEKLHHDHSSRDMHLWLNPDNAKKITEMVARELGSVYPESLDTYKRNATVSIARIEALDAQMKNQLASIRDKPFITLHDAYQYFEHRYGLNSAGTVLIEPTQPFSANQITRIQEKIRTAGAICIFHEPQFPEKLINAVIQNSNMATGVLDPLGSKLQNGPDLYFDLLEGIGKNLVRCLTQ